MGRVTLVVVLVLSLASQLLTTGAAAESETENDNMPGFSWVIAKQLAAMPVPGGEHELDQDLDFLADQRIATLVSLTMEPMADDELARRGIVGHHIPVEDFTAPSLEQIVEFVELVNDSLASGERVGVHCTGGLGRSGTMVAAYLVSQGRKAEEAIIEIRRLRPHSIETASQEQAIRDYKRFLTEKGH